MDLMRICWHHYCQNLSYGSFCSVLSSIVNHGTSPKKAIHQVDFQIFKLNILTAFYLAACIRIVYLKLFVVEVNGILAWRVMRW